MVVNSVRANKRIEWLPIGLWAPFGFTEITQSPELCSAKNQCDQVNYLMNICYSFTMGHAPVAVSV